MRRLLRIAGAYLTACTAAALVMTLILAADNFSFHINNGVELTLGNFSLDLWHTADIGRLLISYMLMGLIFLSLLIAITLPASLILLPITEWRGDTSRLIFVATGLFVCALGSAGLISALKLNMTLAPAPYVATFFGIDGIVAGWSYSFLTAKQPQVKHE
jgi:hypothetical protein